MTEPRKTPRTDGQRLQWNRFQGFVASKFGNVVTSGFARALEIETQELAEALEEVSDELATFGMFSESNASVDPVVKARAALARHRAKQEGSK